MGIAIHFKGDEYSYWFYSDVVTYLYGCHRFISVKDNEITLFFLFKIIDVFISAS